MVSGGGTHEAIIDRELTERERPEQQDERMDRARELLKLETVPREMEARLKND